MRISRRTVESVLVMYMLKREERMNGRAYHHLNCTGSSMEINKVRGNKWRK